MTFAVLCISSGDVFAITKEEVRQNCEKSCEEKKANSTVETAPEFVTNCVNDCVRKSTWNRNIKAKKR